MSGTVETEKPTTESRVYLNAMISARTLEALAPMIQEVFDYTWSDEAFMAQMPTQRFGTYLVPTKKGVTVLVVDNCRLLAVHDARGMTTGPMKVNFPQGMLDAVKTRHITLVDENGGSFDVPQEPRAGDVYISEICGMVTVQEKEVTEGEQGKYPGVFGTWSNGDHGNVRDMASWRVEPADIGFIKEMIKRVRPTGPTSSLRVDVTRLTAISRAAKVLDVPVQMQFNGSDGAIKISSFGGELFALLMPLTEADVIEPNRALASIWPDSPA